MRRRPHSSKYRLPGARKRKTPVSSWILVVVALGRVAWIWWRAGKSGMPGPKTKPPPVSLPQATQQVLLPRLVLPSVTTSEPPIVVRESTPSSARTNLLPAPATVLTSAVSPSMVSTSSPPVKPEMEPLPPAAFPRPVHDALEAQIALARQGLSPGSLDGVMGSQTHSALRAFQRKEHLNVTGQLDAATTERLILRCPPLTTYTVTAEDLARLQPLSHTWLGKSRQSALAYETILEMVSEKGHADPKLVRRLNPGIDWTRITAGETVQLPEAGCSEAPEKAAFVMIKLGEKVLSVFDQETNLLAHFPCSIAQRVEKRPVGELHVAVIVPHPNYTFDPELFPESAEARQFKNKLVLPPGPNNPVGLAWIGLDKSGYGIHGTPSPEQIGRTESHGCFRLANWNAEYLLKLAWVGMPVYVEK